MEKNTVTDLIRLLNYAQIHHFTGTAAAAQALLAKAMAPVVTAHPFPLAT